MDAASETHWRHYRLPVARGRMALTDAMLQNYKRLKDSCLKPKARVEVSEEHDPGAFDGVIPLPSLFALVPGRMRRWETGINELIHTRTSVYTLGYMSSHTHLYIYINCDA